MCHLGCMARGWESKDIESQMEDAREARRRDAPGMSAEQAQLEREREGLILQRSRVLSEMESAGNAGYREILKKSLAFLDEKLAALPEKKTPGKK